MGTRPVLGALAAGWVAALALLAAPSPTVAQAPPDSVGLVGIVLDGSVDLPVVGALITLEPGGRQAISDSTGAFRVAGLAAGSYDLTVRAFGYLALERSVTAAAGRPPVIVRLAPDPVALSGLEVRGDEEVTLSGVVRDQRTGDPIPWVSLWVSPDAQRRVAEGAAGADGVFTIEDVRVGSYLLGARMAGYVPQYTPVEALPGSAPTEILLRPDSLVQAGIAHIEDEMHTRRNAYWGIARAYGPEEINRHGFGKALHFLTRATMLSTLVPCPGLGMCVMNRGRPVDAALIIDDWQVCGPSALDVMATYHPSEIYTFEVFRGNAVSVRAYTHEYMERQGRRQGLDPSALAPTITCLGDPSLEGPGRAPPPRLRDATPPPPEP
jgi:hypothetical protein